MKKKQIMALLTASVMVFGMAACGGGSGDSSGGSSSDGDDSSSGGKQKITVCWRDDGSEMEKNSYYVQMMAAYEE